MYENIMYDDSNAALL